MGKNVKEEKMLIQIAEKQEELRAKKEYEKNISRISDLDDVCVTIDELVERLKESDFEFRNVFIQELKDRKFDVVAEMRYYEEKNFELMEVYEGESEEW